MLRNGPKGRVSKHARISPMTKKARGGKAFPMTTPILLLGAGRMGGALVEGWGRVGAFSPADLILRDPHPGPEALAAEAAGAALNPPDGRLAEARTVLMAVKPQVWRNAASAIADLLSPDAVIVSIAAGMRTADLESPIAGLGVFEGCLDLFVGMAWARHQGIRSGAGSTKPISLARSATALSMNAAIDTRSNRDTLLNHSA